MWSLVFWKAAVERAIRGFAIAALAVLSTEGVVDALHVHWLHVLSIGLGGAALSILMSLAGNATSGNGPSFTQVERVRPNAF